MAHILIIEGDQQSGTIVQRLLKQDGHTATLVRDGLTGISLLNSIMFDLILLDQGLPDHNGGSTIATLIHRTPNHPKIVAMSDSMDALIRERALNSGCVAFIQKPIDTRTFISQIEVFLPPPGTKMSRNRETGRTGD